MPTKSNRDASGEMPFWDHIDALRSVLVKAALLVVVLAVVLFAVMPDLFDRVILAPCNGDFVLYRLFDRLSAFAGWFPGLSGGDFHVQVVNINLASQFFYSCLFVILVCVGAWCACPNVSALGFCESRVI